MTNKINLNQIPAEATALVEGIVNFSRIGSKIEGEELVKYNENRAFSKNTPFYTMTIRNLSDLKSNDKNFETYIRQRAYKSEKYPDHGFNLTVDGTGNLPQILLKNTNGKYNNVENTECLEITNGTKVKLVLKVYQSKNFANKGLGFNTILIEDVKDVNEVMYNPKSLNANKFKNLSEFGIIVEEDVKTPIAVSENEFEAPEAKISFPNETPNEEIVFPASTNVKPSEDDNAGITFEF